MSQKFKFISKKGKNRFNIFRYTDEIVDSQLLNGAHTEIFSNKEIIIEGCIGVFDYNTDYIRLNIGKGAVVLCGSNFDIIAFEKNLITIKGTITSVEFCQ